MIEIKIVCPECQQCLKLENICHRLIKEYQYQADIQKVEQDPMYTEKAGTSTPVLIINDKVFSDGRVPSKAEIKVWIDELLKDYFY
ncbi:MAG: thioredoxin family protein [Bacteroidetes bacterium]|nr:thioredoxin family protein [Bacteroidota bacterium]